MFELNMDIQSYSNTSMSVAKSGLQKDVLSLYRRLDLSSHDILVI